MLQTSADTLTNLAILGAPKAFENPIHVGCPNVPNRSAFERRVGEILDRRWLSNQGQCVQEFERKVAEFVQVKHCLAVCNATVALEIVIRALELQGEVIVPAYTFVATAHALQWQGITPVFADMDPLTHNIDPSRIESLITPRTTGIIGVHIWGRPCDTCAIEEIARRRGLKVIYDAAHALGCTHGGRKIGAFGQAEVFSFHATKFINSLEGGMIATNDDELARRIGLMRNFGFTHYDQVDFIGTNGKMNEVSGAMGLTNLENVETIIASNLRNYQCYRQGLGDFPGLSLIGFAADELHNYQYVVAEVDPEVAPLKRDELIQVLHAENVLARKYFWPGCHRMEPYRSLQPNAHLVLPQTERISSRLMVFPTGQAVDPPEIQKICGIIEAAYAQAAEVRSVLTRDTHKH